MSAFNLVFYDTETTGIQKEFSQILQCGSVFTDAHLERIDEQNIGCAPYHGQFLLPGQCLQIRK